MCHTPLPRFFILYIYPITTFYCVHNNILQQVLRIWYYYVPYYSFSQMMRINRLNQSISSEWLPRPNPILIGTNHHIIRFSPSSWWPGTYAATSIQPTCHTDKMRVMFFTLKTLVYPEITLLVSCKHNQCHHFFIHLHMFQNIFDNLLRFTNSD